MKKKIHKWNYYLITIISSLIVVVLSYILNKITPFGKKSLLVIDFYHQYAPMLGELYDRIYNHASLIYSFNTGMGLPFYRNYFNYLSSPINVLILLFKHKDLITSYSFIIGIKAIISSFTISLYLKEKFKEDYKFIPLAILYAFCAYYVAYYWNIMWIDGMYMLPLIALGIERLVNKDKYLLYIISLASMLYINYFIGYMLCIFSILYYITYLIISTKKFKLKDIITKLIKFGTYSLMSGGLCAFFLIPLFFSLKVISATGDGWPTTQYYAFTFKEFIFNHFSGVGSTVLKSGITCAPNISCGIVIVALLLVFCFNNKINLKTKICYLAFLLILILSFTIAPIDYIWHAMHVPNDLPYRYSFIYSFILIVISAYAIKDIKHINKIYVSIIYLICLILISLMKLLKFENITNNMIIMNYIIIAIYYISYIIYNKYNKLKKYVLIVLILSSITECILTINNNWTLDTDADTFNTDYNQIKREIKKISNDEKSFYRIERNNMLCLNDPAWYNYYGQSVFSSMEYENMAKLTYNMGMPGNGINSYYYKNNTPIYNLMFDIKYVFGNVNDDNYYSLYEENNGINVYKNNYTVGLMYGVNNALITWRTNSNNPFSNQNNFIKKTTGIENVLEKFDNITKKTIYKDDNNKALVRYKVLNNNDNFYFYINNYSIDFVIINNTLYYINPKYDYINNIPNIKIYNIINYNEKYIINTKSEGEYIEFYIGYNSYYTDSFYLYKLNKSKFEEAYKFLNNGKVDIIDFKENNIKATSSFNEDRIIYTSIPYDEGWNIYIDGKKIDSIKIANSLLAFYVDSGNHTIELKYHIPYYNLGLLISITSLITLIFITKLKKNNIKLSLQKN